MFINQAMYGNASNTVAVAISLKTAHQKPTSETTTIPGLAGLAILAGLIIIIARTTEEMGITLHAVPARRLIILKTNAFTRKPTSKQRRQRPTTH